MMSNTRVLLTYCRNVVQLKMLVVTISRINVVRVGGTVHTCMVDVFVFIYIQLYTDPHFIIVKYKIYIYICISATILCMCICMHS